MSLPDLITQSYATAALADVNLSSAQLAFLPSATAAASRLARKHCKRTFTRCPSSDGTVPALDELYTLQPNRPFLLRQYPVNGVIRLRTNPTSVLTVSNSSASVQQATVRIAATGDVDQGQVSTGLTLWSLASAVASTQTILWSSLPSPTILALASAVNAIGSGWSAQASPGYSLYPVADFRGPIALPALGDEGAGLVQHVDDVPFELDYATGEVSFLSTDTAWNSPRWGLPMSSSYDDQRLQGRLNGYRVLYDAGFDVVPEIVQVATAEIVRDMFNTILLNARLSKETDGSYSYEAVVADYALTKSVLGKLQLYRSPR